MNKNVLKGSKTRKNKTFTPVKKNTSIVPKQTFRVQRKG